MHCDYSGTVQDDGFILFVTVRLFKSVFAYDSCRCVYVCMVRSKETAAATLANSFD